ncbi:hypothetical protein ACVWW9_001858 [Agrococcus sp. UYP33]
MNAKDRLWSLGAGLIAIGVAAGAWFGSISPDLTAASTARGDLEVVEQQNRLHELRIVELEEAAAGMSEFEASRDELSQGVPGELQYAEFIRQLDALALETGVTIVGVTAAEAVAYLPPVEPEGVVEPAPAEEAAAETDGSTESEAPTASDPAAAPAEGTVPDVPMPHTDPLIGPENLAAVPITISTTGVGPAELQAFLQRLQLGTRLVSVSSATFAAGVEPEPWTSDISGYLYVLQPEALTP